MLGEAHRSGPPSSAKGRASVGVGLVSASAGPGVALQAEGWTETWGGGGVGLRRSVRVGFVGLALAGRCFWTRHVAAVGYRP